MENDNIERRDLGRRGTKIKKKLYSNAGGPGSSSGKALDCELDGQGSIPGVRRGGDFSSFLRVQAGPGVYSACLK